MPDGFAGEFHQIVKEKVILISHSLFQKIEAEGRLPNSFYEASVTLITKPRRNELSRMLKICCIL